MNTILDYVEDIIGSPSTDIESMILYICSCFIFILVVKLIYSFIAYIFGFKR